MEDIEKSEFGISQNRFDIGESSPIENFKRYGVDNKQISEKITENQKGQHNDIANSFFGECDNNDWCNSGSNILDLLHQEVKRKEVSANELRKRVSKLTSNDMHEIITEVLEARNIGISGNDEDFLELIDVLQSKGAFLCVIAICRDRLKGTKGNYTFVTPLLRSLAKCEIMYRDGKNLLEEEEKFAWQYALRLENWDAKLYEVYVEFLFKKLNEDERRYPVSEEIESKAMKCRKEFPLTEVGYYCLARLYEKKRLSVVKAKDILREAILEKQLPLDTLCEPSYIHCPRCCMMLLRLLENSTDYNELKLVVSISKLVIEYNWDNGDIKDRVYLLYCQAYAIEKMYLQSRAMYNTEESMTQLQKMYKDALAIAPEGGFGGMKEGKEYPYQDYQKVLKERLAYLQQYTGEILGRECGVRIQEYSLK